MKRLFCQSVILGLIFAGTVALAQSPQKPAKPTEQEVETVKVGTNLVTVPVIASSQTAGYTPDLKKEEFTISEDGVAQNIAFFAGVNAPFDVVLMIDTSASTEGKLGQIQQAAIAFLDQLRAGDKVKLISFDSEVHDWNDFSSDKQLLRGFIRQTKNGAGTRLYDAVQMALNVLQSTNRRKAIVLVTDGVDYHSDRTTLADTIRTLDESGIIIYPIRFDTRAEAERVARQQDTAQNGASLPTSEVIRDQPPDPTPAASPTNDPNAAPTMKQPTGRISLPQVILGPTRGPTPGGPSAPTNYPPDARTPTATATPRPSDTVRPQPAPCRRDDPIGAALDELYSTADSYLKELASLTGGALYRADSLGMVPPAFAAIAAELRTQYLLGYYPTNPNHDGSYRKIQVRTIRKDAAIRTRPGYLARSSDK
jgi:VWFA-related protein